MKVLCCGNVKCPYCGLVVKKQDLEAHVASCPLNPRKVSEMSEDRYYCSKCERTHRMDSNIGRDHLEFKGDPKTEARRVEPETAPEEQPEPTGGIGRLRFGGPTGSPPRPPKREVPILQKEDRTFEKLTVAEGSPELCKYIYWARDSCVDCQGHRCSAAADKKIEKSLVEELCQTIAHLDCPYYTKAIETGIAQICPYQGPPPPEKVAGCSGSWCYADDRNIRVLKSCRKFWVNCDTFARKKWAGKPFYRDLPQIVPKASIEDVIE